MQVSIHVGVVNRAIAPLRAIQQQFEQLEATVKRVNRTMQGMNTNIPQPRIPQPQVPPVPDLPTPNTGAVQRSLQDVGLAMTAGVTAPIVAGFTAARGQAVQFETAMASVQKAANLDTAGMQAMTSQIMEMSRTIPIAATEIAGITEAGARLGVSGADNLGQFTQMISNMSVAFDMATGDAANAAAEIANVFSMTDSMGNLDFGQIQSYGDVVNNLADNMATTEAKVVSATQAMSGISAAMGISANQTAALSAGFTALGVQPGVAANAFKTAMGRMGDAGGAVGANMRKLGIDVENFQQMVGQGRGAEAFVSAMDSINKSTLGPIEKAAALSSVFGNNYNDTLAQAAAGSDAFRQAMGLMDASVAGAGATMAQSFEVMGATSESIGAIARNAMAEVGTAIGNSLKGPVNIALQLVTRLAQSFATFARANPAIVSIGVAIAGVAAAIGPVILGAGALTAALGSIGAAIGTTGIVATVSAIGGALLPIIGIAAAVAGAAFLISRNWSTIGPAIQSALGAVQPILSGILNAVRSFGSGFVQGFMSGLQPLSGAFSSIRESFGTIFQSVASSVQAVVSAFGAIGDAFAPILRALGLFQGQADGVNQVASSLGQGLGGAFASVIVGIARAIAAVARFIAFFARINAAVIGAVAAVVRFAAGISQAVATGISRLSDLGQVFSGIGNLIRSAFSGIGAFFSDIFGGMGNVAGAVGDRIVSAFTGIPGAIGRALSGLSGIFSNLFGGVSVGDIAGKLLAPFRAIPRAIAAVVNTIKSTVRSLFSGLFSSISVGNVASKLLSPFRGIAERIGAIASTIKSAIGNLFSGLFSGASVNPGDLFSRITAPFRAIPQAVRSVFSVIRSTIGSALSNLFGGVTVNAAGLLSKITAPLKSIPQAVRSAFTAIKSAIGTAMSGLFSGLPSLNAGQIAQTITGALKGITSAVGSAFGAVKDKIGGALSGLFGGGAQASAPAIDVQAMLGPIQQLPQQISAAIAGAQNAIATAFNGIVTSAAAVGPQLAAAFTGTTSSMSAALAGIPTAITAALSTVGATIMATLGPIGQQVLTLFQQLPAQIGLLFTQIPIQIQAALAPLIAVFQTVFAAIPPLFQQVVAAGQMVIAGFMAVGAAGQQLAAMVQAAIAQIMAAISAMIARVQQAPAAFQAAGAAMIAAVNNVASQMFGSGARIVSQLVAGIRSQIGAAKAAISSVAGAIRGALPFSPAKYGPLSDLHRSGPALVNTVAKGISASPLTRAVTSALAPARSLLDGSLGSPEIIPSIAAANQMPEDARRVLATGIPPLTQQVQRSASGVPGIPQSITQTVQRVLEPVRGMDEAGGLMSQIADFTRSLDLNLNAPSLPNLGVNTPTLTATPSALTTMNETLNPQPRLTPPVGGTAGGADGATGDGAMGGGVVFQNHFNFNFTGNAQDEANLRELFTRMMHEASDILERQVAEIQADGRRVRYS